MRLVVVLILAAIVPALTAGEGTTPVANTDEQTLRAAGLTTEPAALVDFFRQRATVTTTSDGGKLLALARQLGDANAETRAKAAAQLVTQGAAAVPALRHVCNDLDNPLAAEQAQRCLEWLEGKRRSEVPMAAAKLLAARKPAAAAQAMLAYLPFADDRSVVEAVKSALDALAKNAKPDPALIEALSDPVPLRRAVAVEVLSSNGHEEVWPLIRRMLTDPSPRVRLPAALALGQRQEEAAVNVLIDLLAELRAAERRPAEQALQQLAGDWAPNPGLTGDDEVSRKIRRDAWAAWWRNTDGPALLAAFRQRTLSRDDVDRVLSWITLLGDKDFAKRERAVSDLTALGPVVVPFLRDASKSNDAERAQRAEAFLKQIAQTADKHKLPLAAPGLLALRKPAGATEALLAYLPFTDDPVMREEVGKALKSVAIVAGKPDPVVVKTLDDPIPLRRMVAAEIMASTGKAEHLQSLRKLLNDPEAMVRVRVAVALALARERDAVPVLIDLVGELAREQSWEAEEILWRLAGDNPPAITSEKDATPKRVRDAWSAWWKQQGATVDLAQLNAESAHAGLTLIAEAGADGLGRVVEIDRQGKPRVQLEKLTSPVDVWYLQGNRLLIAESQGNRVTERDRKGTILWQAEGLAAKLESVPIPPGGRVPLPPPAGVPAVPRPPAISVPQMPANVQRLPSGNTFITLEDRGVIEVDRTGKVVFSLGLPRLRAAAKLPNGHMVWMTWEECYRLDRDGKQLHQFRCVKGLSVAGGMDVTPKGHVVVAEDDGVVREYDLDGKTVWEAKVPSCSNVTRLRNGRTLVTSWRARTVVELDQRGQVVWQYQSPEGFFPMRARQR